ncbi:velvet factor-domain-containing protein [Tuber borchii]|uniref:Velvet factor-domain-containing protein n=1 Tax=Tuber borchii TaxID=42251 RepID=A0A2T7A8J2_TUBBO|nr:velvet factor-domain-containing protein [Tuber borchii]
MMSPGPPPQPIYPHQARSAIPSSSPTAESPRPITSAVFQPHTHPQLPPPIFGNSQAAAVRFSGPLLAPLANPGPGAGGGGSALPPPMQTQQSSAHIPSQNPPLPQHIPSPLQTPRGKNEGNQSTRLVRIMPSQPFPSPASSGYPSPSPFDQGYDRRRFSGDSEPERRRPSINAMIPSPTYTAKRPIDEGFPEEQQQLQHSGYGPRFTPTSVEDVATTRREAPVQRSPGRYQIQVRQQPVAARACGFGERDRRVIDPPPIVQLIINDSAGNSDSTEMRYPFNVVHCTLWSIDGHSDETALIGMDKRQTRRLMGTLVSSPFVGQDEEGKEGCFFCFPDLSCRTHGKYRLRFVLMRLEPSDLQPEGYTPIITETLSDIFTVYTAKEFPGMRPSTSLTKALKRQGCAISVKKGNEKALGGAPGGSGKDEGSGDDDTPSTAGKPKRRRKT